MRARAWVPGVVAGIMLCGLALAGFVSSWDRQTSQSQIQGFRDVLRERLEADQVPPGTGDDVLPPFLNLLRVSEGVIEGVVTDVSKPKWNLPEGAKYEHGKEYPWDPLTFSTATIRVDRWLYDDGSLGGSELILRLSGDRIEQVLTREEIIDLADLEHHPEIDPYEVVPGGIVYSGDDPYGGLTFTVGERVAVLVNTTNFTTPAVVIRVPQVTGHGAGRFLVDSNGGLRNEDVTQEDAPRSLAELEELIRKVTGTS